ncbi:MAG: DUF2147 domain-containing protein [Hyphomicrobiales bacterium]
MTKTVITLATLGMLAAMSSANAASGIEGTWTATDGKSKIKITKCGSNFCSKIIWLKNPRKDTKNENAALRGRNVVGIQNSNNLKPAGKNKWSGNVYSPKKGKTYQGFATISGEKMTMKGCLTSAGLLCQKASFKRAK